MEKHLLSKSTFIRGVQCLKSLYLNKKRPFLRDKIPQERLLVFRRGHKVGELAQQLFPGGINMSPGHPSAYRKAILNTAEKIAEGFPVIYEAGFQHEQVMILLDILVHNEKGWHAYEVKSSGGISDTYLMDAALQYHVIKGTGLDISGISIIHIDKEYVRDDEIDIHRLFRIVDVTDEALSRQEFVAEQILKEKETMLLKSSPKIDVGPHCRNPYDCDFIGHCWKNEPVPEEKDGLEHFDKNLVSDLISDTGNIAFLKLLSLRHAIPEYQGTHPYQEIPYGFSLTVETQKTYNIFGYTSNPEPGLKEELFNHLANVDAVITFGQGSLSANLLPGHMKIIDLEELLNEDSELRNINDGESLLEKIFSLSGAGKPGTAYTSDAVCTHHYLEEYESEEVKADIQKYAMEWVDGIKSLYNFLLTS